MSKSASGVAEALVGADLLSVAQQAEGRAPVVLVVLGDDPADDEVDAIVTGLLSGLGQRAAGVVVVGKTHDGGEGQLGRFRGDPAAAAIASVDGVETAAGQIAAILTLAKVLTTPGGSFGASGSDGSVPLG